ncbi:MAG TPA: NADPH-dependent assimilatory sulfite reductase hemoprotein subunit [Polyangiales bacterium]|nr:NADPH-dependent assimilatory sulfite reductase hemoprotein subunit [Polyangiales bacterium]
MAPKPNRTATRDRDLSQPLAKLDPNETLKARSRFLRGTIENSLADPVTGSISEDDAKLVKFHGMYMQDDRDVREERHRQKLEPDYQFMVRVRLPGGVLDAPQWLALDGIAREYGRGSLRLTTRQTFQIHGVMKPNLRATLQRLDAILLDTIAACGDDCRGVMCSVNPALSELHREVYALANRASAHMRPKSGAYREIWLGEECIAGGDPDLNEEPFYGPTYLPRKFKIGFAIPPINDIDVYTQDLGFIAIADGETLQGFNVCVGGGMGRTDRVPRTYPRLADVIGFVTPDQVLDLSRQVISIQRDYGDRVDRNRARFKYTLDVHGIPWFCSELETRLGFALSPARAFRFDTNNDSFGWQRGSDGRWHLTVFIENGRVTNQRDCQLLDALRGIALEHGVQFRLTPNQNLVVSGVEARAREDINALLTLHHVDFDSKQSALRRSSMACVAFPTCGLAMAESERYLPAFLTKFEALLRDHGLDTQAISVRMTGCPNGCARPYVAEIGLTGRAPGKYNLYMGGGAHGQRLNVLHTENIAEAKIFEILRPLVARYARERSPGEPFGDFVQRIGVLRSAASHDVSVN